MKKALTVAAVTLAASMAFAHVGAFQGSSQGSSQSLSGSGQALWTSAKIVVKTAQGSLVSTLGAVGTGSVELTNGSVFVLEHPITASQNSAATAVGASTWVVTTTGHVLKMSVDGSVATLQDPVGESRRALAASQEGVTVTIDASGRVMTASGAYLKDKFGRPVELVLTGSGQIYTASAGSVVGTYHWSATTVRAVGSASVQSAVVASAGVRKAMSDMYAASTDAFAAARKAYRKAKK